MENKTDDTDPMIPNAPIDINQITSMFRNWAESGSPQSREDQQNAAYLDQIYKSNMSTLATTGAIREAPLAAAKLHKSLEAVLPVLAKFQLAATLELEIAAERVKNLTLMCGIALLPDELLADIFGFVVQRQRYRKDKAAMVLSHVCRRFRSVALATSSLWTFVRGNTKYRRSVSTQIQNALHLERAAMSSLNVGFVVVSRKSVPENLGRFMQDVLPRASRWRSFGVTFARRLGKMAVVRFFNALKAHGPIHLPCLERLAIITGFSLNTWFDDHFMPFALWTMPRLRVLTLKDFALDLRRFTSLTSLSIAVHQEATLFELLFEGLKFLSSLRSLHLEASFAVLRTPSVEVTLPSVSHLSLDIRICMDEWREGILVLLKCPNVVTLSIILQSGDNTMSNDGLSHGIVADRIFDKMFRDSTGRPAQYPSVTSLHLATYLPIYHRVGEDFGGSYILGYAMKEAWFSNKVFPNLRHLTLEGGVLSPREPSEEEERICLPTLNTVTIRIGNPDKFYGWLHKILRLQELQGFGNAFKHLIVKDGSTQCIPPNCVIIPGAKVLEWLESKLYNGWSVQ